MLRKILLIYMVLSVALMSLAWITIADEELGKLHFFAFLFLFFISGLVHIYMGLRYSELTVHSIYQGLANLRDGDFGVSLRVDERTIKKKIDRDVLDLFNRVGESLRIERQNLYHRELFLDTVIQSSNLILVLTDAVGVVVYSNHMAKKYLNGGRSIDNEHLLYLLDEQHSPFKDFIERRSPGIVNVNIDAVDHVYHFSISNFVINQEEHHLYLFKDVTRDIGGEEVKIWKKVIRVMSHELNNSLAPISSLAHSGEKMLEKKKYKDISTVLSSISERAKHLTSFLDNYSTLSRLPLPRVECVQLKEFVESLQTAIQFVFSGDYPVSAAKFDQVQISQVLLNLVKNAHEAGGADNEVVLDLQINSGEDESEVFLVFSVLDRGCGIQELYMENALLPFYSTKPGGSGIGLSLSKEIIEAHGGRLHIANRSHGGLRVSIMLPQATRDL